MNAPVADTDRLTDILLIEDNRGDAILTSRAFKAAGIFHSLNVANNGEMALSTLARKDAPLPDIILVDLNLPGMGGKEILGAIRDDARLQHIPVFILTSSYASQDRAVADKLNAAGYILKPLDAGKIKTIMAVIAPRAYALGASS